MADLNEINASQSVKIAGANPSTGIEDNFLEIDSHGSAQVNLRESDGTEIGILSEPLIVSLTDGEKITYSAAATGFLSTALATDIFTISGSASKIVRITRIELTATANNAVALNLQLIKRSTLDIGGTSSTLTNVPHDSTSTSATAVVKSYTANPTSLGTQVGIIRAARIIVEAFTAGSSENPIVFFDFGNRPSQAIVLRNANENLAVYLNATTINTGTFSISVEWTEE